VCIANYPKQHSANCTKKHQSTHNRFKPMVRILKNLRGAMVAKNMLGVGVAPSYFLEGLLFNVPDDLYAGSYGDCFVQCINWILETDRTKLVCANRQYYLLREDSPVTWRPSQCDAFLAATVELWNQW
jgi:hypothetical protein